MHVRLPIALVCLTILPAYSQTNGVAQRTSGYLDNAARGSLITAVIKAPAVGDLRESEDRSLFAATRHLQGSPRWMMAQMDDDLSVAGLLRAFQCALGITADPRQIPHLLTLLTRVSVDSSQTAGKSRIGTSASARSCFTTAQFVFPEPPGWKLRTTIPPDTPRLAGPLG
jgi:hypothetical protein